MKKKKEKVIKCINILNKDPEKVYIETKKQQNLDLLTKANSFRKSVMDKQKNLKDLDNLLQKWNNQKKD